DAVKAIKLGSVEFVTKDINAPELKHIVWSLLEEEKQKECAVNDPWFFGKSPALQTLFEDILKNGRHENIILVGACGVGKRSVAEIINDTFAPRYKKLMSINLSLFPAENRETYFWSTLRDLFQKFETEVKGIEEALYDTLYLQGVENCTSDFQSTLIDVLQHRDGSGMISKSIKVVIGFDHEQSFEKFGKFIDDTRVIRVPSLSERKEDIPELIKAIVARYNRKYARQVEGVSFEVLNILLNYSWPGNIRELDLMLESMILLCEGKKILDIDTLPLTLEMLEDNVSKFGYNSVLPLNEAKEIFEKKLVEFASLKFGIEKAASFLKLHYDPLGVIQ
ncbi:sigma 54-interacting transcriptional regulator, partial [Candidatus Margulisiibacteriota bacterium]